MKPSLHTKHLFRCGAFCTAASFDLLGLATFFKKKGYQTRLSKVVLLIYHAKRPGCVYFFNHGTFVTWGFKRFYEEKLIEYVRPYAKHALNTVDVDHFHFRYGEKTTISTDDKIRIDVITLESDDNQIKQAISYGLAQSIKLESFEESIQEAIKKNSSLPEELATKGTVSLSRQAIFKRIGEIFLARNSINLNIEYLDVPEFFWSHPNLEPFYVMTKQFLDIPSRVAALNQKLDVLQELLHMLNNQVEHRHSTLLESIIILLIAVEIVMSLFQFHLV